MVKSVKTFLKHTYKDYITRSVNPPLVRTSTMVFKSMSDLRKVQRKNLKNPRGGHFEYGRQGTATTFELEKILTKFRRVLSYFLNTNWFWICFFVSF